MAMRFRLQISRSIVDELLAHLRRALPAEGCGILAGVVVDGVGRVSRHFPLTNALQSPTEFESDPREQFAVHKTLRAEAIEMLAVYHSHPTTAPVPSRKDIERSSGASVMNIIVGFAGAEPEIRAWWIDGATVEAAEFEWMSPSESEIAE